MIATSSPQPPSHFSPNSAPPRMPLRRSSSANSNSPSPVSPTSPHKPSILQRTESTFLQRPPLSTEDSSRKCSFSPDPPSTAVDPTRPSLNPLPSSETSSSTNSSSLLARRASSSRGQRPDLSSLQLTSIPDLSQLEDKIVHTVIGHSAEADLPTPRDEQGKVIIATRKFSQSKSRRPTPFPEKKEGDEYFEKADENAVEDDDEEEE